MCVCGQYALFRHASSLAPTHVSSLVRLSVRKSVGDIFETAGVKKELLMAYVVDAAIFLWMAPQKQKKL